MSRRKNSLERWFGWIAGAASIGGCCLASDESCTTQVLLLRRVLIIVARTSYFAGRLRVGCPPRDGIAVETGVRLIRWYQSRVSARRPAVCRMTPTCSEYGARSLEEHGFWLGVSAIATRLLDCSGANAIRVHPAR